MRCCRGSRMQARSSSAAGARKRSATIARARTTYCRRLAAPAFLRRHARRCGRPAGACAGGAHEVRMTPERLVRPEILALDAYAVPDATGMVKLDAMENPYPLPPALRAELAQRLADVALNRYPEP